MEVYFSPWGEVDIIDEDEILEELMSQFGTRYYFNTEQFIDERYLDNPPNCWWTDERYTPTYNYLTCDKYMNDLEERYWRYDAEAPKYIIKSNKILLPFINRVFPNIVDNTPNEFIYRFVKFSFNNDCNKYEKYYDNSFDIENYRYFNDVVSIIDAFIEMVNNRLPDKIICRIILGSNYQNFIN